MSNNDFERICKWAVVEYFNNNFSGTEYAAITEDDVYIVWMCKVLQNNKALLSTTVADGRYYEITYNGQECELYVDAYTKEANFVIKTEKEQA